MTVENTMIYHTVVMSDYKNKIPSGNCLSSRQAEHNVTNEAIPTEQATMCTALCVHIHILIHIHI